MTVVQLCARASAAAVRTAMAAAQVASSRAGGSGRSTLIPCAWRDQSASRTPKIAFRQHCITAAPLQPVSRHRPAITWQRCAHASVPALAAPIEGLSQIQQQQIDVFVSFLLEENQKYNLTGVLLDTPTISTAHGLHSAGAGRSAHLHDSCRRKGCRGGAEARA